MTLRLATSHAIEFATSAEALRVGRSSTLAANGFIYWGGDAPQLIFARLAPGAGKRHGVIEITEGIE